MGGPAEVQCRVGSDPDTGRFDSQQNESRRAGAYRRAGRKATARDNESPAGRPGDADLSSSGHEGGLFGGRGSSVAGTEPDQSDRDRADRRRGR